MLPILADYLEVFASDERFLVFASSSIVLATALLFFLPGACRFTRLLFFSAALLLMFAFVVVAPFSSLSLAQGTPELNPVSLNYNFGFLTLGLGLFLRFRHLPTRSANKSLVKD